MYFCTTYISDATTSNAEEKCVPWNENVLQKIDLAFNVFFLFYFLIRVGLGYGQGNPLAIITRSSEASTGILSKKADRDIEVA